VLRLRPRRGRGGGRYALAADGDVGRIRPDKGRCASEPTSGERSPRVRQHRRDFRPACVIWMFRVHPSRVARAQHGRTMSESLDAAGCWGRERHRVSGHPDRDDRQQNVPATSAFESHAVRCAPGCAPHCRLRFVSVPGGICPDSASSDGFRANGLGAQGHDSERLDFRLIPFFAARSTPGGGHS
jgi:hypothetical protein